MPDDAGTSDLRTHLAALRERDLLIDVDRAVDPDSQVAWLMAELAQRRVAGLFTDVLGSSMPALYNVLGSREMVGLALGVGAERVTECYTARRDRPIPPEQASGAVPSQEVIARGEDLDVRALPLIKHSEGDDGRYLTAGLVICHDPETGLRNVSVNRMTPVADDELAIRMMAPQQLGQIQEKAERDGQDLPVAIALGMHPTATLAAASSPPLGIDELALAGGLRMAPVPLAPGVTIPIDVPAEAEIVIEGWVRAGIREPEGPFGDFLDYYVPRQPNHRLRISAITHRRDPIYHTMHAGSREDLNVLGLSREADILEAVLATGADIRAVRLRPHILGLVISLRPRYDGESKLVAMAAFSRYRWLKYCLVVDNDVDPENDEDLWWAIATRADLERDVVLIPRAGGFPRDEGGVHNTKLLLDATAPTPRPDTFLRRRPPGDGPLRLADYASSLRVTR